MAAPHDHIETIHSPDRVQIVAINGEQSFGKVIENTNKEVDKAVEDHIKHGDYVAPPNQPSAYEAVHNAVEHGMGPGYTMSADGFISYGRGLDAYADKARAATRDIDRKEDGVALEHWNALSPAERKIIEQEKSALEQYNHLAIWRTKYDPPACPHLDAYTKGVERAIAPLERERAAKLHKVWQELPVESKAAIFRAEEEKKHFKSL